MTTYPEINKLEGDYFRAIGGMNSLPNDDSIWLDCAVSAFADERDRAVDRLLATPAKSLEGVAAKLRVARNEIGDVINHSDDPYVLTAANMMLSALKDAEELARPSRRLSERGPK